MTDQQKEFLHLCIIEQMPYKTIVEKLNVPNTTLTIWYEELKDERIKIADIRNLWARKKIKNPFVEFYTWYSSHERNCFYCGITESQIKQLINNGEIKTKRISKRGKKLELDRKEPNQSYDNIDNLVFACYWCNNAKTDTFTADEFKDVGKAFSLIWQNKLAK